MGKEDETGGKLRKKYIDLTYSQYWFFQRNFSGNKGLEKSSELISTFGIQIFSFSLFKYGNFIDNLRLFTRGGSGGMGYPRLGGEGGKGGDVWVVAHNRMTLKQLKDKYPQKRFVAGEGANSQ